MRFKTSPVGGRWTPCTWVMAVYSGRDRIYINRKEYSSPALLLVLLKVVCVCVAVCASQKRYRSRNKVHFREYAGDFSLTNITLAQLERAEGPMAERVTKAFLLKDFSLYASCERARVYNARKRVSLLATHAVLFTRTLRVTSSFVLIEGSSGPWNAASTLSKTENANFCGSACENTPFCNNKLRRKREPSAKEVPPSPH